MTAALAALRRAAGRYTIPGAVLLAVFTALYAAVPAYRTSAVYPVLEGFSLLGLAGLAVGVTVLAGELDLSVGSVAALAGVVAARAASAGLAAALIAAVATAAAAGAAQGWIIARLRIASPVVTVGTLILYSGLAYEIAHNQPVVLADPAVSDPLLVRYGVLSPSSITALLLFAVTGLFLGWTRYGREIAAIGGGRTEAHAAGVPRIRPVLIAFTLSGTFAGLAGALAVLRGGSADPGNYGDLLLSGITAALLGGVSLHGGRGTVVHIALGVAVLSVITAAFVADGSSATTIQMVDGALLLLVVALEVGAVALERRTRLRSLLARIPGEDRHA